MDTKYIDVTGLQSPVTSGVRGILYVASFTMKSLHKPVILFLPLLALLVVHPFQPTLEQQDTASPTPTYDPFAEPPLPQIVPPEYELGRNLYWHWCMTCHGDKGQGLTDEFRGIWPSEHQNCWVRGCHSGKGGDMPVSPSRRLSRRSSTKVNWCNSPPGRNWLIISRQLIPRKVRES